MSRKDSCPFMEHCFFPPCCPGWIRIVGTFCSLMWGKRSALPGEDAVLPCPRFAARKDSEKTGQ